MAKRGAKGDTLYKFNIFIITIKCIVVITFTSVYVSIVKVDILLLLPNPTFSTVYRSQQKRISLKKQINLEINKIFITSCTGQLKQTLTIKLRSVFNKKIHDHFCSVCQNAQDTLFETEIISIDTQTIASNFQKAILYFGFFEHFFY